MRPRGARRPLSLAARLTFFISLASIIAFLAFSWIVVHSVKAHFKERDELDLRRLGGTIETILNLSKDGGAHRRELLERAVDGYGDVVICIDDADGRLVFRSEGGPDLNQVVGTPGLMQKLQD
ncbi:MAG: hypothetical protein REJ50_16295, partial [Bordetella sp.]|nr:hypothetical protein [Bordetella sp.]